MLELTRGEFNIMKKIFIIGVLILSIILTGCSKKITWEDNIVNDIKIIEESGFYAGWQNEESLDKLTEDLNLEIEQEGYDFKVKIINIACYYEEGTYSEYVIFEQFETSEQANNYYNRVLSRENSNINFLNMKI